MSSGNVVGGAHCQISGACGGNLKRLPRRAVPGGNVPLRNLGGVQTKFQTDTPMGSFVYAEGDVCLNFELFLVGEQA